MSWARALPIPLITLILTIGLLTGVSILHAISLKYITTIKIPKSYGPCKKCRDLYLRIGSYPSYYDALTNILKESVWSDREPHKVHFVVPWFPLSHYLRKLSYYVFWTGYSTRTSLVTPDYDLLVPNQVFRIYLDNELLYTVQFNPLRSKEWSLIKRDVAGFNLTVVGAVLGFMVVPCRTVHVFGRTSVFCAGPREASIEVDENGQGGAYVSAHDFSIYSLTSYLDGYVVHQGYDKIGLSEIANRGIYHRILATSGKTIWDFTYKPTITYYYTLELGLLARAFWLNGTPVDLPSIGIVDGYVPTTYWHVVRVYPASAFSRNHAVVMHDDYMYYVYYAIPNAVFHVVVSKSFIIVLSNASSCLPDTWCPVASKRCGVVVLYCRAKENSLTVALPTDWNTTIEYVCTLNSSRGLVDLKLESIAVLFQNKTVIGTIYNVGEWNLTHIASGVTYHGKFPAENFVCANDTYRVDVLKTFTLSLNGTLVAKCNLSKLVLFACSTKGPVCVSGVWKLYEAVNEPSLVWNTDSRAWRVVAYYNCSIQVKLCYVRVLAYDINDSRYIHVPIYYADYYNNTLIKANVDYTPFILAVPCNSTLQLIAPFSWKTYYFKNWTGTYVNTTINRIIFKVNKTFGVQKAFYYNLTSISSGLCPIILNTTLSKIWLLDYSTSSNPSSSVSVSASRTCTCNCSYVCKTVNETRVCNCTGASIRCSGSRSSSQYSSNSGYLNERDETWTRIIEAGTLRIPELEGSGWSMCFGVWLQSANIRDIASANASVSVVANESSNTGCGCSIDYRVSASASARLIDILLKYEIYGTGNIRLLEKLKRVVKHWYDIGLKLSKSIGNIGSETRHSSWSDTWSTSIESYGNPNDYRVYNMAGGYYRHGSLIAYSEYSPTSDLATSAYASVSITHNPDEFTCNCSKCGDSCSCSISASSSAYAHAYLKLTTTVTDGELILRAGLAEKGGGWLKPVFNRLVCNDFGCIWYSDRDPWFHGGDLSIDWSPTYPLPGQRVNITIIFDTGDSQPVRLWVYRVVEKVWVNGHVTTRVYSLRLVTPWEIKTVLHGWKYVSHSLKMIADPGHASISFTWKMPSGVLEICAVGWGIFTRLINKCWIITPPIVIVDIFPIRVLPIFKNGNVAGYHGLVTLQDIVAPREVFWYGVLVRVFVPDKYTITLSVPSSFTIVDYSVNSIRPISSSGPISVSRYFRTGLWLILYPAGIVLPYRGRLQVVYVNNVSVVTYLAPSLGPGLDYATYRIYATISNYFIYHELLAVSRIVLVHVISSYYMLQHYILPIVKWAICLESSGAVECHGDPYVLGRAYMLELYCPHNIVLQYVSWSWYNSDIATRYITDLACRFYHVACSYPIGASAIAEPSPVVIRSLVGSYCRLKLLDTYLSDVSRYVKYSIRGVYVRTIGRIYRVELHDDTVRVCCHICKILLVEKVCRYGMLCIVARTSEGISEAYINIVRLTRSSIYVTARLMPTILDEVLLAETYRTYMRVG